MGNNSLIISSKIVAIRYVSDEQHERRVASFVISHARIAPTASLKSAVETDRKRFRGVVIEPSLR
jgi:hypothetical protein